MKIYNWLSDIINEPELTTYLGILADQGYDTVSDLKTITASDLKSLGITKQMHVKKILIKNGQGTDNINTEGTSQGMGTNASANMNSYPPPSYGHADNLPPVYSAEGNGDQLPAYNQVTNK